MVGEIFLGTNDACDTSESVIDVFRISNKSILVIPVSQVIPVIPVSQVFPVIPVIPVSQVIPVRLAHLWVDLRVIGYIIEMKSLEWRILQIRYRTKRKYLPLSYWLQLTKSGSFSFWPLDVCF